MATPRLAAGNRVLDELFANATLAEAQIIEDVGVRAGFIWICPVAPWTNYKGSRCGDCNRTEEEARNKKEVG